MTEVVGLEHPSEKLILIDAARLVDVDFLTEGTQITATIRMPHSTRRTPRSFRVLRSAKQHPYAHANIPSIDPI